MIIIMLREDSYIACLTVLIYIFIQPAQNFSPKCMGATASGAEVYFETSE